MTDGHTKLFRIATIIEEDHKIEEAATYLDEVSL